MKMLELLQDKYGSDEGRLKPFMPVGERLWRYKYQI